MPSSSATWQERRTSTACPSIVCRRSGELAQLYERLSLPVRRARVAAIALNTAGLDGDGARRAIRDAEGGTGLVADDPVRNGPRRLLEAILERLPEAPE